MSIKREASRYLRIAPYSQARKGSTAPPVPQLRSAVYRSGRVRYHKKRALANRLRWLWVRWLWVTVRVVWGQAEA